MFSCMRSKLQPRISETTTKMSSDPTCDVLIIGAGLTGLSLAHQLRSQQPGLDVLVLEARDRIGGRIHTATTSDGAAVEMGATWFFPFFRNLFAVLKGLKVELMPQYMKGATLQESSARSPPRRYNSGDDGDMFRIKGGTGNIVNTLYSKLDPGRVLLSQVVTDINKSDRGVEVVTRDMTFTARKVVTTVPPQLLAHTVKFSPALPTEVMNVARETHTWMGDSMKGAITYAKPFWKEEGLAGALYSNAGPFVQMYDQTSTDGEHFALVGFMDDSIAHLPEKERRARVVAQLSRVFGKEAENYLDYKDTFWADEEFTMPSGNVGRLSRHKNNGHSAYSNVYMGGSLYIGGTETSSHAGGYMEGAVTSAANIAKRIKDDFSKI